MGLIQQEGQGQMTTDPNQDATIPACRQCQHYRDPTGYFKTCDLHRLERVDFVQGRVYSISMDCWDARGDESLCGREGRNFVQNDTLSEDVNPGGFWKILRFLGLLT